MKKVKTLTLTSLMLMSSTVFAATEVTSYKSPYCGCCTEWEEHMKDNGYDVNTEKHEDMAAIKEKLGVDPRLASCHTAVIIHCRIINILTP